MKHASTLVVLFALLLNSCELNNNTTSNSPKNNSIHYSEIAFKFQPNSSNLQKNLISSYQNFNLDFLFHQPNNDSLFLICQYILLKQSYFEFKTYNSNYNLLSYNENPAQGVVKYYFRYRGLKYEREYYTSGAIKYEEKKHPQTNKLILSLFDSISIDSARFYDNFNYIYGLTGEEAQSINSNNKENVSAP